VAKRKIELPIEPLPDLMRWWRAARVRGTIIGGLAVSLLSRPRLTRDIDAVVLVDEDDWEKFLALGQRHKFLPRIKGVVPFARESRVFLMRHGPSGKDVDLAIAGTPFESEVVARASKRRIARTLVPLASPEDLVIYKAVAQRPQDIIDIATIVEFFPDLDVARIRRWTSQFAEHLEDRQIVEKAEPLLAPLARPRGEDRGG
jgi:hypothetical protein